jgi:hypothetical protein
MPNDLLGDIVGAVVTGLSGITAGATYHLTPGTVRDELKAASLTIDPRPVYAASLINYDVAQEGGGFHRGTGEIEVSIVMSGSLDNQAGDLRKAARDILLWIVNNEKLGGRVLNMGARARFELDRETSLARGLVTGSVFFDFVHRYDHAAL